MPKKRLASLITIVSIDPEVSYIGAYALNNLNATVQIDNGNTTIAEHAFDNAGENFVIVSVFNSPVHTYAKEHDLAFEGIPVASGDCGENARWKIYPDGTLHIIGSGAMTDYYRDPTSTPWYSYASTITKVLVDEGITFVSPYTIFSASACMSATILGADTQVSNTAFQMVNVNFTIYGHLDSSAQEVAQERGYQFEAFTIADGTCGPNVTWTLYTNGLLRIDGEYAMAKSDSAEDLAFYDYADKISAIEIGPNITKISKYTYYANEACTSFTVLNPGAIMPEEAIAMPQNVEIQGYYESTAQAYAEENNIPFAPVPILASGSCGENASWWFHETGMFNICGTGAVNSAVWGNYPAMSTEINVGKGITYLSGHLYFGSANCTKFAIRNPDTYISSGTIANILDSLVIYGDIDSTAQAYANNINANFKPFILGTGPFPESTWTVYANGELRITGRGPTTVSDKTPFDIPWDAFRDDITSIDVAAGIINLPGFTYFNQENCTSITIWNPNLSFKSNTVAVKQDNLVIYGYKGSTAETYAASHSITFVPLD